ncbi:MAG: SBBP repeat-containing protein [Thermoanaerobaculia bacterium]|nr:SBBP repeat-containing protein [Thermoanaerobaculia bacterium]
MKRQSTKQAKMRSFAAAFLLGAAFVAFEAHGKVLTTLPGADAAGRTRLSVSYGNLPLSFEANQGQSEKRVKFLARGRGYGLFLTPTEAVLSLRASTRRGHAAAERAATSRRAAPDEPVRPAAVVRMRLVGANEHPDLKGLDPLPGTSNYFIGDDPARWQRDVPNYARVKAADVYPGIDLIYYGNQRQLEYDIVVAPDADPRRITLAFEGVQKLSLDPEGNLVLRTSQGDIEQHKPVIYQDIDGKRQPVDGRYVLHANGHVGFQVARYDTTRSLVIDPVLSYSTYLGGGGTDVGRAIAVDSAGCAYVTGETNSVDFPGASTSLIQPSWSGSYDVFVAKLNAAGNALVYSTYLGGSGGDFGYAIAVDSTFNAYVTGETDSPTVPGIGNIPFPRVGALQGVYAGGGDAFVTKINPAGNALVYSTYLGGSGTERGYGIAVDGFDEAYVTGHTSSVNGTGNFPTASPFQSQNGSIGSFDAFVTKVNAAGSGLVYSTYLGGNGSEYSLDGGAIAVDSDGNAYVGGTTASTNFPGASTSTIQALNGGGFNDGFVVKFNSAGSALYYSTYLGGTAYDAVNGIAIDTARNAYVAGYTDSINFPTASPLQASRGGPGEDAFVAKLNAAGSALVYSTYLGGSGGERAYAVGVDRGGNAYVSGFTSSTDFPTAAAFQSVRGGTGDAFVSRLNAAGSALRFSTYLGGSTGSEHAYGIAVNAAGSAWVTGETNSTNFPTAGPFQPTFGGSASDAFVTKFVLGTPNGDYDGDGRTDITVYRPSSGTWWTRRSSNGVVNAGAFGISTDIPAPGDYDGDGKWDIAIFRPSTGAWWILRSTTGTAAVINWGISTDVPVPGDYDGDGKTDIAVFRPSSGTWYVLRSSDSSFQAQGWGLSGDVPVPGDYDGDGKTDIAVYRPSTGTWYVLRSSDSAFSAQSFGLAGDIPVPGDYDGDGKTDIAIYRPSYGTWWILRSSDGTAAPQAFGISTDVPVAGDYDGDGKTDIAIYRPSTGTWWILRSSGGFGAEAFGLSADKPAVGSPP